MTVRVTREEGAQLEEALAEILPLESELPYANFAPIAARAGAAVDLHRTRWRDDADTVATLVARTADRRPRAAVKLTRRPFESAHFDLPMAKIDQPVGVRDPATRAHALSPLLREAIALLRADGFAHVAARASTRDSATAWTLQELGAFHVDTQVSWMGALTGAPHDERLPPELILEIHDRDGLARLDPESWRRLALWAGSAFDRGPLVFDPTVPHERALQVYQAWTEKALTGDWADAVLLIRHGPDVVAFISMLTLHDVSAAAGVHVCGRGLGATLPEYRGLFTAIQREMITARPLDAAFMENETQVATIGSINVYAKLGFRYLRSTSTFHLRLDGRQDRSAQRR